MRIEGWTLILLLFAGLLAGGGDAMAEPGSTLAALPDLPGPAGPSGGNLKPGGVLVFDSGHVEDNEVGAVIAMATDGTASFSGLPVGLGLARYNTLALGTPPAGVEVRLLSRAVAVPVSPVIGLPPLPSVAETEVYEYVEFEVNADDDDSEGTVLQAQVTGRVDIRGWLALVGYGQVEAQVFVELEDVSFQDNDGNNSALGDDYPRYVVHREKVAEYELSGTLGLGTSASAKVEAGSLTAAEGGAGLSVGIDLPLGLELVRDSVNFAFLAAVQRGHFYRIRLTFTSRAVQRLGICWAAFGAAQGALASSGTAGASESPVDLLDPDTWLDTVTLPFLDRGLPDLGVLADDQIKFTIPSLSFYVPGALFDLPVIDNALTKLETQATVVGHTISLPSRAVSFPLPSLVEKVTDRLPKTPREALRNLLAGTASLQQSAGDDEVIEDPGVQLVRLEVMLEQDIGAEIEKDLKSRRRR